MGNQLSQMFPPTPKFTEKELPDQTGKVFIVTGASSGVGKELAQILYSHNAKVYVAARSSEKAEKAIESIKVAFPNSKGAIEYLHLDLDDLSTIKASAEEFLSKEKKLDVLWNNAGVMAPPQGSRTKQGYELQLGTNNVAPFLFTKLLTPILKASAKVNPPGSTRVVWVSSSAAEAMSPKGGVDMANLDYKKDQAVWHKYGVSKAGNVHHAKEFAKRYGDDGIISVALNPGNLKSDLQRHIPRWQNMILQRFLYAPIYGAYTELFAGLSPDVTSEKNGAWIIPWGRFNPLRADIEAGSKSEEEGGTGISKKFWEWSEEQVKSYL
ncbi:hypothetical protein BKA64DRAFT_158607 [Cadophora sp. MPI-SDFR-AT-0126]|nr:hypothetical protein BKA64DRAFT_158607 [Leotiomycetes sp. MPI-SDFR-AT-0126]